MTKEEKMRGYLANEFNVDEKSIEINNIDDEVPEVKLYDLRLDVNNLGEKYVLDIFDYLDDFNEKYPQDAVSTSNNDIQIWEGGLYVEYADEEKCVLDCLDGAVIYDKDVVSKMFANEQEQKDFIQALMPYKKDQEIAICDLITDMMLSLSHKDFDEEEE